MSETWTSRGADALERLANIDTAAELIAGKGFDAWADLAHIVQQATGRADLIGETLRELVAANMEVKALLLIDGNGGSSMLPKAESRLAKAFARAFLATMDPRP
jgi:hypothetical protein